MGLREKSGWQGVKCMTKTKWRWLLLALAAAVLVAAVLMLRHRMSLPTNTVCLTLEQDVGRGYQGHWVGMSMVYVDGKGALHCNNIPSLQGLWQLDEAYAQEASVELESDTDMPYVSVYCAVGKLRLLPRSVMIFRFDESVVDTEPGTSPQWTEGQLVEFRRHGNFYRLYDPRPGVYVARVVTDQGVQECAWWIRHSG